MKNSLNFWLISLLLLAVSITAVTPPPVYASGLQPGSFLERELECLARNIYYEAGNEPYEGKIAVAQVTVNRSEDDRFPESVCSVVNQKTSFANKIVCQFSWVCAKKKSKIDYDRWAEANEIAEKVLLDGFRLAKLKDALYFHATHVNPNWSKVKVAKIGNHVFYRDRIKS